MSHAFPAAVAATTEFSSQQFRQALGQFATGVTVVTARSAAGERVGLTVSSFNSVSLEPPLVLWSLNRTSHSMTAFDKVTHYAIHVLGADQQALGERFAGPRDLRWGHLTHSWSAEGSPLLPGCLAVFECVDHSRHEAGDHVIFVGRVMRCTGESAQPPLLYHGGQFHPGLANPR
jgi:flavin reductase (DIM6/NTAB) family NADH-FMN oxidoreductase RutF